jgi:dTDP-4-dehydrorhamnose reductase
MKLINRKILLTGGSGALGTELIPLLENAGAEVIAPSSKELNVIDLIACVEYAKEYDIDIAIHAGAWTDVPGAELAKNRHAVTETNIFGCANFQYAFGKQSKCVYISTDYVYAGIEGNYSVKSKVNPSTFYGFSKLAGESFFQKTDLIIRTSFASRDTWGEGKKQLTGAFDDVYTSKDWVDVISRKIVDVISKNKKGIVNIGTKRKTIYSLAKEEFPDVKPISYKDVNLPYDYPVDCSLKSSI